MNSSLYYFDDRMEAIMARNESILTKLCRSKLFVGGNDWVDEFCNENTRECSSCSKQASCSYFLKRLINASLLW